MNVSPLLNIAEEVLYYKKVYPLFSSRLIYYTASYNLERSLQLIDKAEWISFLQEELKLIPRFFKKHNSLYEYYRLDLTELDQLYFSNNSPSAGHLLPKFPATEFTPAAIASYTLAKFMALERLRQDIGDRLSALENPGNSEGTLSTSKSRLKWTGETINLVEVAYGLWLTGQINNGNASITEIIEFLESRLHVKIGRPYRRWTEVSRRKTVSATRFIDQMKLAIYKRIDDENRLG